MDEERYPAARSSSDPDRAAGQSDLRQAITGWEIAIKDKLGKWPEAAVLLPDLAPRIEAAGFTLLPLTFAQAERAGSLDLVHRDPFDRLLAAQAIDRDLVVATIDPALLQLGCRVI